MDSTTNKEHSKIQFIQHLRAISILLVLIYHMGLPVESGFLGVDIFFFISGYIVANVLSEKYFNHNNSLKLFYINRFWRLYPSLIISLTFTLFLSIALQTGNEILTTLKYIIYGLFGVSNFLYYKESGIYGTSSTDNNPLIHLWSLSVEFQFYLFFPILYFAINKFSSKYKLFIVLMSLISSLILYRFSLQFLGLDSKIANENMFYFYFTPFRLYEFLFGVFVYQLLKVVDLDWDFFTKLLFTLLSGATLLIFLNTNIADQDKHLKVVSLMLLLSCMVIVTKNKPRSARIWQKKLEVFGSYAYPIYLVHLPVITLVHIHYPENQYVPIIVGILSLLIGILISKTVEIRQIHVRDKTFLFSTSIFLLFSILITGITFNGSFWQHRSTENRIFTDNFLYYYDNSGCTDTATIGSLNCTWSIDNYRDTVFVAGDSQASFGLDAIIPAAKSANLRIVSGARKGCPFIDDVIFSSQTSECTEVRDNSWLWIKNNKPKYVVIANLSTGYLKTSRKTITNPGGKCPDINGLGCKGYEMALRNTVERINEYGSKVVLLQTVPNYTGHFERSLFNFNPNYTTAKSILTLAREPSYLAEVEVSKDNEISLVDSFLYLCQETQCPLVLGGKYLYANSYHISTAGAQLLIPKFTEIFQDLDRGVN